MIINDLVPAVISKMRNRTELSSKIPYYIAMALLDLTENNENENLKVTGPVANFVPSLAEYPLRGYDPNGVQGNPFVSSPDHRITLITSWFIWFDTNGMPTLGQSTGKQINKKDERTTITMSKILGIPSVFTFLGDKINNGVVIVGQMPDNPYATQMRYQREHPFSIPYDKVLQSISDPTLCRKLGQSIVYMDNDWVEILVLATAEKACDDVGMNEIGQSYHQKLFGYKDKRGNETPGLIQVRQTQQERNSQFNSRQLRPVVRRYTR